MKAPILAIAYFFLSTVLTWWFIESSPLYISMEQMLLSCSIAGGKWMIQILAALVFLTKGEKWIFIKNIGFTCFIGSALLVPYAISSFFHINNSAEFFLSSLLVSVLTMIGFYYRAVRQTEVSLKWWLAWLFCLAIAVTLQLTVVFPMTKAD